MKLDIEKLYQTAREATKQSSVWAYRNNYCTGEKTISVREPTAHTRFLSSVTSKDYAKVSGVSTATARNHLYKLSETKKLYLRDCSSRICSFSLCQDDLDDIGREIIADLVAQGIPFDDDWRESRKAAQK